MLKYQPRLDRIIRRNDSLSRFARFLVAGVANTVLSFIAYRLPLSVGIRAWTFADNANRPLA